MKADAGERQKEAQGQAEREQNYQQAMAAGLAALRQNDYTNALRQAELALGYRANDPIAKKLKADTETAQKNAAAQVERDGNYQRAMEAAKAFLASKDYPQAIGEAERALGFRANDAVAKQLISDADARQKEAQAQAGREKNYQVAMTEATNAWRRAELAFKQTNYAVALTEITAAFNKCSDAEKLKPGESVSQLKPELEKLSASVRTAKAEMDYGTADSLKQAGKFEDALRICQGYSGNNKFEGLKKSLTDMQTVYSASVAKLAKGEYDFLGNLKSSGLDANPFFAQVVASGRSESEQLSSLTQLTNDNQRLKLKDQLQALPKSVAAKAPFQQLANWVEENDPVKQIVSQIIELKIKLGLDTKTVLKGADGKQIKKLGVTENARDFDSVVDRLEAQLKVADAEASRAHEKDFKDIRSAINNWQSF
jgi:hypothetical protein